MDLKGGVYAGIKEEAKKKLNERKIATIDWNSLTNDSAGATTYEKQIEVFNSTRSGKPGTLVVLMHDNEGKEVTVEALKYIIKTLKDEGYVFKTFYEIYKRDIDKEGNTNPNIKSLEERVENLKRIEENIKNSVRKEENENKGEKSKNESKHEKKEPLKEEPKNEKINELLKQQF